MLFNSPNTVFASNVVGVSGVSTTINEIYLSDIENVKNRPAGSLGEKIMAEKLSLFLQNNGFSCFNSLNNFTQEFNLTNGKTSQNIIGEKNIGAKYYVVVGAHYDAVYVENKSYGYNDNLSGVVGLMELAKNLPALNYNLIVAFWGAEEIGCLGSKYFVENLPNEIKDNILLYLNLDTIGAGDYRYYYTNDFSTPYSVLVSKILDAQGLINASGKMFSTNAANGANYYTLGMQSDNSSFLKAGINSINFFTGNLSSGNGLGYFETKNHPRIMHNTDTLETIETVFADNHFAENIAFISSSAMNLLQNLNENDFAPNQVNENLYSSFVLKLSGVVFIGVWFIVFIIIFKLKYKEMTIKKLIKK
jgi:Zn-dependent M28 family amino/carboxypeptidase